MEYLYLFVTELFLSVSLCVSPPLRLSLHWPAANWSPTALSTSSSGLWRCGREQEKGRERERVMTRAELWTLTTFPSGPISLREKNMWQWANVKQREMEGTNDKKTDRQKDGQSRERSTTFISHDPVVAMWPSVTQPKQHCGRECPLFCDHKFSLLSLYYINSDNVSQEACVCVCVSSHFNLLESSLWEVFII